MANTPTSRTSFSFITCLVIYRIESRAASKVFLDDSDPFIFPVSSFWAKYLSTWLLMQSSLGSLWRNILRTQGAIALCVDEERWWILIAKTVITMDNVTNIIVNTKYSPISGITLEDDGIISSITRRKTVKDTSTEVQSEIFSPSFEGR